MKNLSPLAAVVRPLGDAHDRQILDAYLLQCRHYGADLALASVNQHHVRPDGALLALSLTFGVVFHRASEPADYHLAHHGEIVVGFSGFDVPFAILPLQEAFRPGHHHRAQRMGALDMRVIVDFDTLWHFGQVEEFGQLSEGARLGAGFRQPALQRFGGIAAGLIDQALALTPLGIQDFDLAAGSFFQRFGQKIGFRQRAIQQDDPRRGHLFVELSEKGQHHLAFVQPLGMGGKEGAMAPVLPTANKKRLYRHLPAVCGHGEDIGVGQALGIDGL